MRNDLEHRHTNLYKDFQQQNDIWNDVRYPEVTYRMTGNIVHSFIFLVFLSFMIDLYQKVRMIKWKLKKIRIRTRFPNFCGALRDSYFKPPAFKRLVQKWSQVIIARPSSSSAEHYWNQT